MPRFKKLIGRLLSWMHKQKSHSEPVVQPVKNWKELRRLTPISKVFGLDRGQPICRYYIESFLLHHRLDIRGRVLEMGDASYTHKFGDGQVTQSDVLHATPGNPHATIVGDLVSAQTLPHEAFDCVIFTQTLLCIYDAQAGIRNIFYALKPGGVLLATFPGISQISRYDMDHWGDYWRFTDASAHQLFGNVFGMENIKVETYGNVLVSCAYLHGLAAQELEPRELDFHDPDYQLLITVRATRKDA